jgi:phage virion morphogenesis protein
MSGVKITVQVRNVQVLNLLNDLSRMDTHKVFDEIGAYLVSETNRRFQETVDPDGKAWVPSQRAILENGKTLVDHGHLRDSITHLVAADGRGVQVGTNMVYGAIHQFGGQAGRGRNVRLIARPYLGINDADVREIEMIAHEFLRRETQRLQ